MSPGEIKAIVAEVLAEQKRLHEESIDSVVLTTVVTLLTSFGFEEVDRKELQADFRHLRKWRVSVEQVQSLSFKAIVTAVIGGFIGAIWLGAKAFFGK